MIVAIRTYRRRTAAAQQSFTVFRISGSRTIEPEIILRVPAMGRVDGVATVWRITILARNRSCPRLPRRSARLGEPEPVPGRHAFECPGDQGR